MNTTSVKPPAYMYPWEKRTLFLGKLPQPIRVAYGAATLVISLGKPIHAKFPKRTLEGYSFLIPPNADVIINTGIQTVAVFHLDVLGEDYKMFTHHFATPHTEDGAYCNLNEEADYRSLLTTLYQQPSDSSPTYNQLSALLDYTFSNQNDLMITDPEIAIAVDTIKRRFEDNIPITDLANMINMSVPTLMRRFKQQTGMPIRRLRLWHRMYESMIFISSGQNLTDAAYSAGFADSAHYTRTFQNMWGIGPSSLFNKTIRAHIIAPAEPPTLSESP
ncbi:MAG: helix-turn-helix transcriptional regulator [Ketobacter sp.]|nr:helix-turn-helix transcriptional regulator [Ketobacter sp.]